jgi:hypothetical protein
VQINKRRRQSRKSEMLKRKRSASGTKVESDSKGNTSGTGRMRPRTPTSSLTSRTPIKCS